MDVHVNVPMKPASPEFLAYLQQVVKESMDRVVTRWREEGRLPPEGEAND
jgi:hypothetical protein